ncbi:MAG: hypothetical protein MJ002_06535 [Paludibacteraceae bacterium]|nr:hypothetical protein [Paludibacteraceae bacterium]
MNEPLTNDWAVIKNPTSGFRSMKKDLLATNENMRKAGIGFSVNETRFAGHAIELTKELLGKGYRRLIVVGGDGTLNEVVNGIMTSPTCESSSVTLALLPHGTGNDWGRYWGMRRGKTDLVKIIQEGKCVKVDVGRLSFEGEWGKRSRYFINGLGFGLDAKVCFFTNKLKDIFGGHHWLYTLALVLSIFTHKIRKCTISDCKGKEMELPLFSASVGNSCYSGGGLKQTDGDPTDGLMFATVIKRLTFVNIFRGLSALFAHRLWEASFSEAFITDKLKIRTTRSLLFELDGVMVDAREETRQTGKEITEYEIEMLPAKINMLVP